MPVEVPVPADSDSTPLSAVDSTLPSFSTATLTKLVVGDAVEEPTVLRSTPEDSTRIFGVPLFEIPALCEVICTKPATSSTRAPHSATPEGSVSVLPAGRPWCRAVHLAAGPGAAVGELDGGGARERAARLGPAVDVRRVARAVDRQRAAGHRHRAVGEQRLDRVRGGAVGHGDAQRGCRRPCSGPAGRRPSCVAVPQLPPEVAPIQVVSHVGAARHLLGGDEAREDEEADEEGAQLHQFIPSSASWRWAPWLIVPVSRWSRACSMPLSRTAAAASVPTRSIGRIFLIHFRPHLR